MLSYLNRLIAMLADFTLPDDVISKVVNLVAEMQSKLDYYKDRVSQLENYEYVYAETRNDLRETRDALRKYQTNERNITKTAGLLYLKHEQSTVIDAVVATGNSLTYDNGTYNKITFIKGLRKVLTDNNLPNGLAGCKDAVEEFLDGPEGSKFFTATKTAKDIQALREKLYSNPVNSD